MEEEQGTSEEEQGISVEEAKEMIQLERETKLRSLQREYQELMLRYNARAIPRITILGTEIQADIGFLLNEE